MKKVCLFISWILLLTPMLAMSQEQPPACLGEWPTGGEAMDAMADSEGNVYVTDRSGYRVLKFDRNGALLQQWTGFFNNPRGLAIDSHGFVYVGSWNSGEIHKFDANGNLLHSWISSGAMYVAIDANDDVWITSFMDNQVRKFDSTGTLLLEWPVGSVSNPRGIAVDSTGSVYVTEQGTNRVRKFDQFGNPIFTVGSAYAWDVAVDGGDNVYLAETSRVVKYDSGGNYLGEWSSCEIGTDFSYLHGIGANAEGDIFLADNFGRNVRVFGSLAPVLACDGFEPPMANYPVTVNKSRALPLKAEVIDADGFALIDVDLATPPVVQVWFDSGEGGDAVDVTDDVLSVGQGDEGNQFVFTEEERWQFNLSTKNYTSPGTYTVLMQSGDDSEYVIEPTCMTEFVIK